MKTELVRSHTRQRPHPVAILPLFPRIVGTRNATARIPDGALIEIDGDAGTVRVLAG